MQMNVVWGVLFLFLLAGCARVPKPTLHEYSYQRHMQAAHHWNVLANDVADQVANVVVALSPPSPPPPPPGAQITPGAIPAPAQVPPGTVPVTSDFGMKAAPPLRFLPVYVPNSVRSPFDHAFHTFLTSALIERGIPVSFSEGAPFKVEWEVLPVVHATRRDVAFPLGWVPRVLVGAVAGPWVNVEPAFDPRVPHTEVIITSQVKDARNNILSRHSTVYYVNDQDASHYWLQAPMAQRTLSVVGQ
jgi:hypothetical protein